MLKRGCLLGQKNMDSLHVSTSTLNKDLKTIKDHILQPLQKEQEALLSHQESIPLCQITRLYRLETLTNIFSATIDAIQNFAEDEEMSVKAPGELIGSLAQNIEKESLHIHRFCSTELSLPGVTITIQANMGQEIEKKIAILHNHVEQLLRSLKKSALELRIAGITCSSVRQYPETELNEDDSTSESKKKRKSIPSTSPIITSTKPVLMRKMSFMGYDVVKTHGEYGQVDLDNTLIVDTLLKQLPLKYDCKLD